MQIKPRKQRTFEKVEMDGARGAKIAPLLINDGEEDWPCLRQFILGPGGHTPYHEHPWFHQIVVGRGIVRLKHEGEIHELKSDDVIRIDANEKHQFRNPNHYEISFYCLIPSDNNVPCD